LGRGAGAAAEGDELARAKHLRALIRDIDFTIVSNNCWGGHVYEALHLAYKTPFVGLFIPPADYLALLRDFDRVMSRPLAFADHSRYARYNAARGEEGRAYPIGLLGDAEIHFLHFADRREAREKWERRRQRMTRNPSRRFFKFDDRDAATAAHLAEFARLPYQHKVCFTARPGSAPSVLAPAEPGTAQVLDGLSLAQMSREVFNVVRWLSTAPAEVALPSLI
jgi:uncharacterized protein (DUF1919 family)